MKRMIAIAAVFLIGLGSIGPTERSSVALADDAAPKTALPEGADIIEKYIEATGGREAYAKISSRITKGTMDIPAQGLKAAITITQQAPDKGVVETEIPGLGVMKQGSDGDLAWADDPMQGARILAGAEREALIRQLRFDGDTDWKRYFKSAETLGVEDVDGKPAYKVKLVPTTADAAEAIAYYDKETNLVVRMDTTMQSPMGNIAIVSKIGGYKEIDGIKMPTSTSQEAAGMKMTVTLDSIEHNKEIDPTALELPAEVKKLQSLQPATRPGN